MFRTLQDLNIHAQPDPRSPMIGQVAADTDLPVDAQISSAWLGLGLIWHKLADREGWVAERDLSGEHLWLRWAGEGPPPPIPSATLDSRTSLPRPPESFNNGALLEAIQQAVQIAYGHAKDLPRLLEQARLSWLARQPPGALPRPGPGRPARPGSAIEGADHQATAHAGHAHHRRDWPRDAHPGI
ncbi:MAG: SH3 domain-containing protein [Anaerolineae bacterium]|nr:SH3 domain-containing protein [Anaerolineae bacterium]